MEIPVSFEEMADWYEEVELRNDPVFLLITEAFTSSFIYKHLIGTTEEKQEAEDIGEEKKSKDLTSTGSYSQAS